MSLKDSIEKTINTHPDIVAEHKNQDAFRKYIDQEEGDYKPTLDLETYYEESHTYNSPDDAADNDAHKNGWNAQLKLEQILYDGGLTPSEIDEYQYKYDANRFRSNLAIEDLIFETTSTYLDLVQYHELKALSTTMISVHERNLITAKEKEEISGEKLETFQVSSKLHLTKERLFEQEDLSLKAQYDFKRYVGMLPNNEVCRPLINEEFIPESLEKTVKFAVRKNFSVREQIENIKVQREKLRQADAKFLPTLLFQLQAEWDDDLELVENGRQDEYRARLFMSWNLFEGGKDKIASQREVLFLQESKKVLDSVTAEIVANVTNAFNSYEKHKKRVEMLKLYVLDNKNILDIYIEEFDAGTRTFIDILNAEAELYNSKTSLIGREYELMSSYYGLLSDLSILSDTILSAENQSCANIASVDLFEGTAIDKNKDNKSNEDEKEDLELEGLFEVEETPETPDKTKKENILEDIPQEETIENNEPNVSKNVTDELFEELEYEDEKTVEAVKEEKVIDKKVYNSDIKEFMDASPQYYTLNVTTESGIQEAKYVLKKYGIKDKGYTFRFGKNLSKSKVLYGVYPTYSEAKNALVQLNGSLLKKLSPYVDSVNKHQKLYNKYN